MKRTRVEKKRIKQRWRNRILVLITITLVFLFVLFKTSFFSVKKIIVVGAVKLDPKYVVQASRIQFNQNVLSVNISDAEKNIREIPYIKDVNITREGKNKIKIKITERKEEMSVFSNGEFYILDKDGKILSKSNNETTNVLPVIKGFDVKEIKVGDNVFQNEDLSNLKEIIKVAEELGVLHEYLEIRYQNNQNYGLVRVGNTKIEFGPAENIKYKFNFIKTSIETMESQNKKVGSIKLNLDPPVVIPED